MFSFSNIKLFFYCRLNKNLLKKKRTSFGLKLLNLFLISLCIFNVLLFVKFLIIFQLFVVDLNLLNLFIFFIIFFNINCMNRIRLASQHIFIKMICSWMFNDYFILSFFKSWIHGWLSIFTIIWNPQYFLSKMFLHNASHLLLLL